MARLRFQISMSLDGFIAGPNPSEEHPLGEGGMQLHEWAFKLAAWRKPHGQEGGEVNASTEVVEESLENIGATVMGRNMFGGGPGPGGGPLGRLVGRGPALPHAGLRAHPPRARAAGEAGRHDVHLRHRRHRVGARAGQGGGGGKDVALGGGANVVQQYLAAGLVDELQLNVVPVLLGDGTRLFDNIAAPTSSWSPSGVVEAPDVTHLKYRVAN